MAAPSDPSATEEPPSFTVIYTEALLQDAVRTYVWRRFVVDQARIWIVALVMTGVVVAGIVQGSSPIGLALAAVGALIPVFLALIAWWVHGANTLDAFRRMRTRARISRSARTEWRSPRTWRAARCPGPR